jgi:hypothetical protein
MAEEEMVGELFFYSYLLLVDEEMVDSLVEMEELDLMVQQCKAL